jgi:hypothetical protein
MKTNTRYRLENLRLILDREGYSLQESVTTKPSKFTLIDYLGRVVKKRLQTHDSILLAFARHAKLDPIAIHEEYEYLNSFGVSKFSGLPIPSDKKLESPRVTRGVTVYLDRPACPHCHEYRLVKYGKYKTKQKYRCNNCWKSCRFECR